MNFYRSSGLGLATAQELFAANAYIAILDISPVPEDAFSASTSSSRPLRWMYVKVDVRNMLQLETAVERVVEWTRETRAELGGVICSAGLGRSEFVRDSFCSLRLYSFPLSSFFCNLFLYHMEISISHGIYQLINSRGQLHSTETWNLTMDVNVSGSFHLARLVVKHLVNVNPEDTPDGERGVVIFISSEAAVRSSPPF